MSLQDRLVRQSELLPFEKLTKNITIIGAGAVGSFTTVTLAKMGFHKLTVYDFDFIEMANMNCQFYKTSDISRMKVDALTDQVKDFTEVEITTHPVALNPSMDMPTTEILISAVDSMEVRKELWERAKKDRRVKWFVDTRMGGESILLYTMNPKNAKDIESYEKTLYSTKDAEHERCTMKATMYTVNLIAGLIGKVVKDLATDNMEYTRILSWDVAANHQMSFNNKPEQEKK